ncbi:MAG TPA: hypothetical protein VD907_06085 [Verrucomicrobiae bacterium]|nr:hypothetical protein [Verrucomicrobiae bacterium]
MRKTLPAGKQARFSISQGHGVLECNWRLNEGANYYLSLSCNFTDIPNDGDPWGIVEQIARLARLEDSGVTSISVHDRSLTVSFNSTITREERGQMLVKALRAACFGRPTAKSRSVDNLAGAINPDRTGLRNFIHLRNIRGFAQQSPYAILQLLS